MQLKTDPWYTPAPGPNATPEQRQRYARAVRLSAMREGHGVRDAAYAARCIERWQDYLDGKIDPPTGRRPQRG